MRKELLPYYLQNLTIRGFEDDDDDSENNKDSDNADDDDDDDGKGEDEEGDKNKPDNEALKSALRKERAERKRLAREMKALQKFREETESKDKSEADKAKDDASKATAQAQKLAARLKDTAVDNAIIKIGGKLKFRDIDDALKLIDRGAIEIDQDEDDPAEIDLNEASVEAALKKLAKDKPHLIVAEGQEEKSGSKFAGSRKTPKDTDEDALRKQYPALNRSSSTS